MQISTFLVIVHHRIRVQGSDPSIHGAQSKVGHHVRTPGGAPCGRRRIPRKAMRRQADRQWGRIPCRIQGPRHSNEGHRIGLCALRGHEVQSSSLEGMTAGGWHRDGPSGGRAGPAYRPARPVGMCGRIGPDAHRGHAVAETIRAVHNPSE